MSFEGLDLLNIDSLLTDEERLARDSIKKYVENEVSPIMPEFYEKGEFPDEIIPKLGELGVLGANLPEKYGCAEMNNVAYGLVMQELEACDSGIRSFASVQGALCMYPIFAFGNEVQRTKYLPKMATGEIIGCFGLTEPNFGSNPVDMITKAEKVSGGFIVNGSKAWITNGSMAHIAIVWAKIDNQIRGFILEKGMEGYSTRDTKHKLSLRASVTSELFFNNCFVPEENLLPNSGGLKSPLMCLTQARYGISWGAIGAAMSCYSSALNYANQRIQFGRPISAFQLTQEKLAKMITEICKAQLLSLHIGRLKDQGKLKPVQVSMAKMNNVSMALDCARTARGILGANGITGEYPVMRHMCNLESVYTYEGTNEVHLLVIGQAVTGIPAFADYQEK
ncbi:MAG: acyl-CoA dehydrogenase family protein [Acidobacteriota bacterium]